MKNRYSADPDVLALLRFQVTAVGLVSALIALGHGLAAGILCSFGGLLIIIPMRVTAKRYFAHFGVPKAKEMLWTLCYGIVLRWLAMILGLAGLYSTGYQGASALVGVGVALFACWAPGWQRTDRKVAYS